MAIGAEGYGRSSVRCNKCRTDVKYANRPRRPSIILISLPSDPYLICPLHQRHIPQQLHDGAGPCRADRTHFSGQLKRQIGSGTPRPNSVQCLLRISHMRLQPVVVSNYPVSTPFMQCHKPKYISGLSISTGDAWIIGSQSQHGRRQKYQARLILCNVFGSLAAYLSIQSQAPGPDLPILSNSGQ